MGAKTWMLAIVDGNASEILKSSPKLDRERSYEFAKKLFPSEKLALLGDGDLSFTCPPDNEILVGCFPGLSILAAKEFGIDYPSKLHPRFVEASSGKTVYLHAMHSVVDWFAYAVWVDGKLERSLSISPDSGILEAIGPKQAFEEPYWSGLYPACDPDDEFPDYPLPFHPLDLGEAALSELFGYQLEGEINPTLLEPETIPLLRFKRSSKWWKFW
ncbi:MULTISPECIES: DUF6928 family protein [Methylomonas]|uniref:Uncharacterized protein n=2 Tax=Methylomonas TaxID=416 RepID=A0A140E6Q0_9GAMM|nr:MULTISPECIES: hypothetical protein [Methylomonas]AMK79074.1 hypothetical protein JT25_021745 [Methylomonas denitrificans]OAI09281.1 hypothetical protein A1342_02815 [Methylomonas methanica]TCV79131.1 hypothetical protein EDE11_1214 [Methylomonas methanica]